MTQKQRILRYMEDHGSISQKDASMLGIGRLAARILELRRAGYAIECEWVPGVNEYGPYRYGRYRIAS